jgi:peptide deformylase
MNKINGKEVPSGSVLPIISYITDDKGDLSKPCVPVTEITPETAKLIDDMILTMVIVGGLGLSAPQVGVHLQIFVVSGVVAGQDEAVVCVNPEMTPLSEGKNNAKEYCLSYPDMGKYVERYNEVQIKAYGRDLKQQFVLCGEGVQARVLQHEMDHMRGITLIDK